MWRWIDKIRVGHEGKLKVVHIGVNHWNSENDHGLEILIERAKRLDPVYFKIGKA